MKATLSANINADKTASPTASTVKFQIKVEIETRTRSIELQGAVNSLMIYNPETREDAARIIRDCGFASHVGGHHVGILLPGSHHRIAIVTSNTPDFN